MGESGFCGICAPVRDRQQEGETKTETEIGAGEGAREGERESTLQEISTVSLQWEKSDDLNLQTAAVGIF